MLTANYFAQIERSDRILKLSRSNFCEARDKLSWEAFAYLLEQSSLENQGEIRFWRGHRVRAIDGTSVQLPRSSEILKTFPVRGSSFGEPYYPNLNLVVAADIFTGQPTHTFVGDKYLSERECLRELLCGFNRSDICIDLGHRSVEIHQLSGGFI